MSVLQVWFEWLSLYYQVLFVLIVYVLTYTSALFVVCLVGEGWKPWDYAAGTLLVEEAGGCISSIDGSAFDLYGPSVLAACTVSLQQEVVSVIAGVALSGASAGAGVSAGK